MNKNFLKAVAPIVIKTAIATTVAVVVVKTLEHLAAKNDN